MNANWEAFEADIDGAPAWILFNESVARELRQLDLPNLLRVQADYEETQDGLPGAEDEDRLQALETELEDWIKALDGRYVGQVTAQGQRTMFFYVACGREEAQNLIHRISLRMDIPLGMKMQADPSYSTYFEQLLPTADERRKMRDMAAIAALSAAGDSLREARPIEHAASFANRHQAIAFANWAGKRLPTEAEWEYAAGGEERERYPWGPSMPPANRSPANIWQGAFPWQNDLADGFAGTAPVGTFEANSFGLSDMAGNVWEWVFDLYRPDAYRLDGPSVRNPLGPDSSHDPQEPGVIKRVMRGGSFLCSEVYCTGYRISARMKSSADTGLGHTGFRCALTVPGPQQRRSTP